jgi:uncharacterized caspase-like protein
VRTLFAFGLALLVFLSAGHIAFGEKRVALVIGNGAYIVALVLRNPKNDAEDIATPLKKLGFKVIPGIDLDKRGMDAKILEFANAPSGAETGVFQYSGHGLQIAGVNYPVPVDAKLETGAALDFEAARLDLVQRTMEREARTNILFLDACRNNPLACNLDRALGSARPQMAPLGLPEDIRNVSVAAAPGVSSPTGCARPSAPTSTQAYVPTISASELPGLLPLILTSLFETRLVARGNFYRA